MAERLLDDIMERAGFSKVDSIIAFKAHLAANGAAGDIGWIHILVELSGGWPSSCFPQDDPSAQAVRASIERFASRYSDPKNLVDDVLTIAEPLMGREPAPLSQGVKPETMQGLEATLWRAYDGLRAAKMLYEAGLHADAWLALRAAQEALLLHRWLRRYPDRARKWTIRNLIDESVEIANYLKTLEEMGVDGRHLRTMLDENFARLKAYGVQGTLSGYDVTFKGNQPEFRPQWGSLVQDDELFDGTKAPRKILYIDTFQNGNRSAHCLPLIWDKWVKTTPNGVKTVATTGLRSGVFPRSVFPLLDDFALALHERRGLDETLRTYVQVSVMIVENLRPE